MKKIKYTLLCVGLALSLGSCSKDKEDIRPQAASSKSQDSQTLGPYSASPSIVKILSDYKVVLQNVGNLATGVYICDIYKSEQLVTLPAGQVLLYNTNTGASQPGYRDFTQQTPGTLLSQVTNASGGTDYTITTYSIIAKYNSIGQAVPQGPYPQNLIGNTFTYSVYVF
ncbi:hypothetical protein E4631_25460 [Hymenobacter sp. UV11]|uniref:hypothetical protein n=1 Tax=Hymenobacter sp. UV11 TaxID=1849735 RepID=UPI0010621FD5|nr:hypothetical protein [Hymenobacter sp. UV11]TFZ62223.1 hypothetical protein E4631_25460 [Hymenobacter sp. UV11]